MMKCHGDENATSDDDIEEGSSSDLDFGKLYIFYHFLYIFNFCYCF